MGDGLCADQVGEEYEGAGRDVSWPAIPEDAERFEAEHYPVDVWTEAARRWQEEINDADREATRERVYAWIELTNDEWVMVTFKDAFALLDIVFFGLAIVTAFRIGGGSASVSES
ncbi:MAG: hypothetical protein ACI9EF_002746 [Pseudohongiellaceae bacterium]